MKIVVAGIYRSGSTWLFNAVRLLLISEGVNIKSYFYGSEPDTPEQFHVIKTHTYSQGLFDEAGIVITSYRNYKDIEKSMKAQLKKGLPVEFENAGNYKELDTFIRWLLKWNRKTLYMMEYDKFIEDPKEIVRDLYECLRLKNADIDEVYEQLCDMKSPEEGYDPVTLLTSTHP